MCKYLYFIFSKKKKTPFIMNIHKHLEHLAQENTLNLKWRLFEFVDRLIGI